MVATKPLQKTDAIIVVGAGIFGLSTALHLGLRGYKNVTVFDRQPYDDTKYEYTAGADSASSDNYKIIRSGYGSEKVYQDLSTEAIQHWNAWNEEILSGECVPDGMTRSDKVFINNGHLSLTDKDDLPEFEKATIQNMEAAGQPNTQLVTTDPGQVDIADRKGLGFAIDPFQRRAKGKGYLGVLDTTGGVAVAHKACRFALHKARLLGVNFVLDPHSGAVESFCYDAGGKVNGVQMKDGKKRHASKVVVACGGWTPSILPVLDGICETTAGSVILIKIPPDSALYERLAPERFPSWAWNMRDGKLGGLYGFPRDENGYLKIGYRGTKYTNPKVQEDGKERSVPVTRYTAEETITQVPQQAMKVFKSFILEYFPDLAENGIDIELTRLCWYTDSFDNHYVVDNIPGQDSLMVATGGSGHAFKYLPNVGKWVVDIIEGVGLERDLVKHWRWRTLQSGEKPFNVLQEGSSGPRALRNVEMSTDKDLKLSAQSRL
ncbi:putative sarcosine oxidase [Exophiala viscosa]|uniref:putative sarcosine oxidase n=1 Tax=Exophiala viscosa TaxID=2486360 RepID=UPI0021994699|nr:putative sarcosine oxidase [Exophiala viscosa]